MERLLCACVLLSACAGGPHDTAAPPDPSEQGPCDGAPVVTWANFGQGFFTEQCMGCHASTAPDRYGAPTDVVFDTVEDVWARRDAVLAMAASEAPAMPPGGAAPALDREKLVVWLTCAEEGT